MFWNIFSKKKKEVTKGGDFIETAVKESTIINQSKDQQASDVNSQTLSEVSQSEAQALAKLMAFENKIKSSSTQLQKQSQKVVNDDRREIMKAREALKIGNPFRGV